MGRESKAAAGRQRPPAIASHLAGPHTNLKEVSCPSTECSAKVFSVLCNSIQISNIQFATVENQYEIADEGLVVGVA